MLKLIGLGLLISVWGGCKPTSENDAPELANIPPKPTNTVTPSPTVAPITGIVEAKLAGYPQDKSAESVYTVSVTGAKEYKWKYGESTLTDCNSSGGYTSYQPISNALKIDLSDNSKSNMIVKLCVVGRSDNDEQKFPTEVSWIWTPGAPTLNSQVEIVDGDNQVKIVPTNPMGNWVVVRSRSTLSSKIQDGMTYTVNQAFGGGTVIASGAVAEVTDSTVKNGENWTYTIWYSNTAKRYSEPLVKVMAVTRPDYMIINKSDLKPSNSPISHLNNGVFLCLAEHFNGSVFMGLHPGRTTVANNVANSSCRYEFGGVARNVRNFKLPIVTKGDPFKVVEWRRLATNNIDTRFRSDGFDIIDINANAGNPSNQNRLYFCRAYNADQNMNGVLYLNGIGKFGPHLGNNSCGFIEGTSTLFSSTFFDGLMRIDGGT